MKRRTKIIAGVISLALAVMITPFVLIAASMAYSIATAPEYSRYLTAKIALSGALPTLRFLAMIKTQAKI